MKHFLILPLALLIFTGTPLHSQAPLADRLTAGLAAMISTNKALLDAQKKTLDTLDQLDQTAQQLKIFGKRS